MNSLNNIEYYSEYYELLNNLRILGVDILNKMNSFKNIPNI